MRALGELPMNGRVSLDSSKSSERVSERVSESGWASAKESAKELEDFFCKEGLPLPAESG